MAIEIERKFLVKSSSFKESCYAKKTIQQGFLISNKNRVVRVRIINDDGFITIKWKSNSSGTSRFEWEKEISLEEAKSLMLLCEKGIIEKTRYYNRVGNHTYEIDEFSGENKGLLVAEVELTNENEAFEKPNWLGEEVTGITKYYNSSLIKFSFKNWT